MNNLKNISDKNLHDNLVNLASKEKQLDIDIIEHLQEVERRKLYSDFECSSLYSYCVEILGFNESQTYQRIKAMRLTKNLPEIKEALSTNKLTLTNVSLMGSLFNDIEVNKEEQKHLISQVEGKSRKECEDIIKKIKQVHGIETQDFVSIKITKEAYEMLLSLQNETKQKNISEAILEVGKEYQIQKIEKLKPQRRSSSVVKNSRFIPKPIKYAAFIKNQGKCTKCGTAHYLEYEHKKPYALGGDNSKDNIELLCRNCNLRSGIKLFGDQILKYQSKAT